MTFNIYEFATFLVWWGTVIGIYSIYRTKRYILGVYIFLIAILFISFSTINVSERCQMAIESLEMRSRPTVITKHFWTKAIDILDAEVYVIVKW